MLGCREVLERPPQDGGSGNDRDQPAIAAFWLALDAVTLKRGIIIGMICWYVYINLQVYINIQIEYKKLQSLCVPQSSVLLWSAHRCAS